MQKLPLAKMQNIVVQEFGGEVLIYDLVTNKACALNETAAIVYLSCDGKTSVTDLVKKHKMSEALIYFSLEQLSKENLIENAPTNYFGNLTRREVIKKVGLTSLMALPVISAVVAPTAVSAATCIDPNALCPLVDFTQGPCCPNFRCSGVCDACYTSGLAYAFAGGAATPAFCAAQPSKNLCCDTVNPVTGDGNNCFCP